MSDHIQKMYILLKKGGKPAVEAYLASLSEQDRADVATEVTAVAQDVIAAWAMSVEGIRESAKIVVSHLTAFFESVHQASKVMEQPEAD